MNRASKRGFTLIELLVVIGIAAMLITMAGTSFFGAMRQESVTKSRNQFRDTLLLARQQACILGKTHVLLCWNTESKVTVGNKEQKTKQGRYALFQAVGTVWNKSRDLMAPFGFQREQLLSSIKANSRVVNLNDPEDEIMRIERVASDDSLSLEDRNTQNSNHRQRQLNYAYFVGGSRETLEMTAGGTDQLEMGKGDRLNNPDFWVATLRGSGPSDEAFPMAVRVTSNFALPQHYAFDDNVAAFVFAPDGSVSGASSITAAHSVSRSNTPTFSASINGDGEVTVK